MFCLDVAGVKVTITAWATVQTHMYGSHSW